MPTTRTTHRRWLVIGGVVLALLIGVVVVLAYFQPQKLFIDDRVDEAFPVTSTVAGDPVAELSGSFSSREHGTTGTATVYLLSDGRRVLRLADLHTSNGPALVVYLSTTSAHGPNDTFDDTYVDLGALKGNIGDQNYELPANVDLAAYQSVVIWCDRFDVAFGAADLVG